MAPSAIKNSRVPLTPIRLAIIKQTRKQKKKISVGEVVEALEPLCTVGGNVKWCSCCGNSMAVLKIELPYDPAMPLLGLYPKELKAAS